MILEQQCYTCGQGLKVPLPNGACPVCLGKKIRLIKKMKQSVYTPEEFNRETVFLSIRELVLN